MQGELVFYRGEEPLYVEYTYTPGAPVVLYLPNGDPGYPADPADITYSVTDVEGRPVELSVLEEDELFGMIEDLAADEGI